MGDKFLDFLQRTSIVWKTALGSGLSWQLAKLAGTQHPFLAPITLILCLRDSTSQSLTFTMKRVFGTILGILIIIAGMALIGDKVSAWELTVLMFLGLAITKLIRLDNVTIREAALSILLVLALEPESGQYWIDRMRDTVIGAFVAMLFFLIILPINDLKKAKNAFKTFADQLAHYAAETGQWLEAENTIANSRGDVEQQIDSLFEDLRQTLKEIQKSRKDLFLNLYAKPQRAEVKRYEQNIKKLENGLLYLGNVAHTCRDWSDKGNMTREERSYWADYLYQLSTHIRQWEGSVVAKNPPVDDIDMAVPVYDENNGYKFTVGRDLAKLVKIFQSSVPEPDFR
ncbi:MAG TPA: FUSC family protein [Bacillales bacterium]|nr:FUSC family protein [Bacillales bacterium]